MSVFEEEDEDGETRRRTEKVLYMRGLRKRMSRRTEEEEVEEDCEEKD